MQATCVMPIIIQALRAIGGPVTPYLLFSLALNLWQSFCLCLQNAGIIAHNTTSRIN